MKIQIEYNTVQSLLNSLLTTSVVPPGIRGAMEANVHQPVLPNKVLELLNSEKGHWPASFFSLRSAIILKSPTKNQGLEELVAIS